MSRAKITDAKTVSESIMSSVFAYYDRRNGTYHVLYDSGDGIKETEFACRYGFRNSGLDAKCTEKKKQFSRDYFGDEKYILNVGNVFIAERVRRCLGKKEEDVRDEMRRYWDERHQKYLESVKATQRWMEFKNQYGAYIIGIDKAIDVYPAGFSVRVLFNSDKGFEERRQFVKDNSKEIVRYVMGELEDSKSVCRKIGDMSFYKPVQITTLKVAEAEVKFEVKRDIA